LPGKKNLLATTLSWTGANRLLQSTGTWNGLVVLNYHRVGNPRGCLFDRGVWSASAEEFDRQMRRLSRCVDVISPADLGRALRDRRGRYALVTFDDGYIDNYELAFPILRTHRVPATFFITSGFLDDRRVAWWDDLAWMVRTSVRTRLKLSRWTKSPIEFDEPVRERAIHALLSIYKQLPHEETDLFLAEVAERTGSGRCPISHDEPVWMTWDMVREMRSAGMHIGGHTVTHPVLSRLPVARQAYEVTHCKTRIEQELDEPIEVFSYPVGAIDAFNTETMRAVEKAGYLWAFSFHGGFVRNATFNPFNLPRVAVDHGLSAARFDALIAWPQVFAT
jgi:peptidoglycan/xylan/chitin deacetylase (PgdA/CDA1 family)